MKGECMKSECVMLYPVPLPFAATHGPLYCMVTASWPSTCR